MYITGKFAIVVDGENSEYINHVYENAICEITSVDVIENEAIATLMIYGDLTREVKVIQIGASTEVFEYDTRDEIERRLLQVTIENVCLDMVFADLEEGS